VQAPGDSGGPVPSTWRRAVKKMTLDLDLLAVETFATSPELARADAAFMLDLISRRSCIEQCTTSCVP
jgi:hypothetical protein